MMEHKGYVAKVEFDDEAGIFHGEVLNLRDVITFQGTTVASLRKAFHESVDDYLDFCAQRNEPPEKPYSGRFIVRIDPSLHKTIATKAKLADKSLNTWLQEVLRRTIRSGRTRKQ
jgi:predicted HicB family RNase H-like nuclease